MTVALERHVGPDIARVQAELAALRTTVLREWPYLRERTPEDEARELQRYVDSGRALAVIVRHNGKAVGATTAIPVDEQEPDLRAPFERHGHDTDRVLYLGPSVLLPPYRRRGLGARFFQEREAHGRRLGCRAAAFAEVERPGDHPARPRHFTSPHAFWRTRGYEPHPELTAALTWQDVEGSVHTPKTVVFWTRTLEDA